MADMRIDDATLDAQVTGAELLPASDGGNPRAVSTEKIKDFVLDKIADLSAASGVDASTDGVYILKSGEFKPVPASVLAAAVLDYAFALSAIITPNGNEKLSVKDGNTKKSMTLDQIKGYVLAGVTYGDALTAALAEKVDKVTGKGLSAEDFTTAFKTKLTGIEAGAQANVKPDWNAASGSAAEILNKPTITSVTVDSELSPSSQNAIANDVVTGKFSEVAETFDRIEDEVDELGDTVDSHGTRLDAIDDASTGALKTLETAVESKVPLVATKEGGVSTNATCALHVAGHSSVGATTSDGVTVQINIGTSSAPDLRTVFATRSGTTAAMDGLPARFRIYDDTDNPLTGETEDFHAKLGAYNAPLMLLYDVQGARIYINVKYDYAQPDFWHQIELAV